MESCSSSYQMAVATAVSPMLIFHGIFDMTWSFLQDWPCGVDPVLPNPAAMMDCRLRLPCLVHALRYTKFGGHSATRHRNLTTNPNPETVAKWGNWHCGESKERFTGRWIAKEPTLFEPYIGGEAVRVVILGKEPRQIRLTGKDWRKSVHGAGASSCPLTRSWSQHTFNPARIGPGHHR